MASLPHVSSAQRGVSPLALSRQLLLVVAPDWGSSSAQLQRFARTHADGDWRQVGAPLAVGLGKSGLGWGLGLHEAVVGTGPVKREGDGRAPAGIFAITALFGDAAPDAPLARGAKLPYRWASHDLKCIDDPASEHYNRIVDQSRLEQRDWTTCEDMRRDDQCYALGAVVAHNSESPVAGAGSCIFLHVWKREGVPTAGCTAMSLADMGEIFGWLDGATKPLLVQLPREAYEGWRQAWGLPTLAAPG